MTAVAHRRDFGQALRTWRTRRHRSQLTLASEAGVSQRHISFLETGKSQPSREMVVHLSSVLDVPLRDRNAMLVSAGYAPVYPERSIDHPDLSDIRTAITAMLEAHNPFPAYVINRHWDLLIANDAAVALLARLPPQTQALASNVLKLVLHPDGLRGVSQQWEPVAAATLQRLEREVEEQPMNDDLRSLLDEVSDYPGLPSSTTMAALPVSHNVLIPLTVTAGGMTLSFYTAISTLVAPTDVTLEELRLETLLPADESTRTALTAMA